MKLTTGVARYVLQEQHDETAGHVDVFSVCNSIELLLNIGGELACACGARQQGRLGLGCKRVDGHSRCQLATSHGEIVSIWQNIANDKGNDNGMQMNALGGTN